MAFINDTLIGELKELPVETFEALEGKWPVPGGEFWDHRTDEGKRLCWEVLHGTSANAPKVCAWLWAQEDLPGFRSSGDMKTAAASHEAAVRKAGETIAHWSDVQKERRQAEKLAAAEAKDAPSKAADSGAAPEPQPEVEAPKAPATKAGRKPRAKQTAAA